MVPPAWPGPGKGPREPLWAPGTLVSSDTWGWGVASGTESQDLKERGRLLVTHPCGRCFYPTPRYPPEAPSSPPGCPPPPCQHPCPSCTAHPLLPARGRDVSLKGALKAGSGSSWVNKWCPPPCFPQAQRCYARQRPETSSRWSLRSLASWSASFSWWSACRSAPKAQLSCPIPSRSAQDPRSEALHLVCGLGGGSSRAQRARTPPSEDPPPAGLWQVPPSQSGPREPQSTHLSQDTLGAAQRGWTSCSFQET